MRAVYDFKNKELLAAVYDLGRCTTMDGVDLRRCTTLDGVDLRRCTTMGGECEEIIRIYLLVWVAVHRLSL